VVHVREELSQERLHRRNPTCHQVPNGDGWWALAAWLWFFWFWFGFLTYYYYYVMCFVLFCFVLFWEKTKIELASTTIDHRASGCVQNWRCSGRSNSPSTFDMINNT
jgi:hypothetical protein